MFAHNTELSLVIFIIKYADKLERDTAVPLCPYFMNLINKQNISLQPNTLYKYPYILESNPRPFYSFRGLKIRCRLESRAD